MPNRNFWNKNVLRVEYDHRVRETRLRLNMPSTCSRNEIPQKAFGT